MQTYQLSFQQYNIADLEYQHLPFMPYKSRNMYIYCHLPHENILARIECLYYSPVLNWQSSCLFCSVSMLYHILSGYAQQGDTHRLHGQVLLQS